MRILHFLWSGGIGGAERAVHRLATWQLAAGDDVAVVFGSGRGPYVERFRALGCRVVDARLSGGGDVRALPRLVAAVRPYDVHHFHSVEPLMLVASALSGRAARVFTERGGTHATPSWRKRLRFAIARPLMRRLVHGHSGNTAHAARTLAQRYGLPLDRVAVTPNGIDFAALEPRRSRDDVRAELGLARDAVVVGTSAHLKPWKRVHLVLDAAAAVPAAAAVVVGDGPQRAALERHAAARGVVDRCRFVGMTQRAEDYVAAMDVFVLPSTALESFGNAAVEAMALGIPTVVMADSPGLCEHIRHGETGFVARDPRDLSDVVARLAADAQLRAAVGAAGATFVRGAYPPERMGAAYRALYADARARLSR